MRKLPRGAGNHRAAQITSAGKKEKTIQYDNVIKAAFLCRPNRFAARVDIAGQAETVHVKNTGRMRELLIPGAEVYLAASGSPGRKTRYDLIAVRKDSGLLINIDSQAPNLAAAEWLAAQGFDRIRPECRFGASRIDFFMERGSEKYLMEVKGCTLERNGIGYFPDAPTARGVRHLQELAGAAQGGYRAILAFVIQMDGVSRVLPNTDTHPEFAIALERAKAAGVRVLCLPCHVETDSLAVLPGVVFPAEPNDLPPTR